MKNTLLSIITLFLTFTLLPPNAFAQDYIKWGLPDRATARLGKGKITGNIAFSPNGVIIVTSSRDNMVQLWIHILETTSPHSMVIQEVSRMLCFHRMETRL